MMKTHIYIAALCILGCSSQQPGPVNIVLDKSVMNQAIRQGAPLVLPPVGKGMTYSMGGGPSHSKTAIPTMAVAGDYNGRSSFRLVVVDRGNDGSRELVSFAKAGADSAFFEFIDWNIRYSESFVVQTSTERLEIKISGDKASITPTQKPADVEFLDKHPNSVDQYIQRGYSFKAGVDPARLEY